MGLFDKLKQQGMDLLQQGTGALSNLSGNQQSDVTPQPQQSEVNASHQQVEPPVSPTPPPPAP